MDAAIYFKWNRAADLLAPLLFESLGDSLTSSIVRPEMRNFDGSETFAKTTPVGGAVLVAYTEGWLRVWDGTEQLKGDAGQRHLWEHALVDISFTDKGIHDIAALVYGYEETSG